MMTTHTRLPLALLLCVMAVGVWSAINPHDQLTWFLESFPIILALPLLILTARRFPLTPLAYWLIALHCCVLLLGAHYTYALVPLGDWIRDNIGGIRNNYDRIGHFMQGFVPALLARELLLRTSPLRTGKWMYALIILSCMGISALYELIEWGVAIAGGASSEAFLGTQGDSWDTQKDMALAGLGAIAAILVLSKWHDRQLSKLPS